jgi:hypothetical protein
MFVNAYVTSSSNAVRIASLRPRKVFPIACGASTARRKALVQRRRARPAARPWRRLRGSKENVLAAPLIDPVVNSTTAAAKELGELSEYCVQL